MGKEVHMKKKQVLILVILILTMFVLGSCTAGPNPVEGTGDTVYGFWWGLWHGIISPITFVISIFNENVHIYEVHNNGGWYNFGFLWGVGGLFGGGSSANSKRKR